MAAGIVDGTIVVGGQVFTNLGYSAFEIAFYRALLAAIMLLPVCIARMESFREIFAKKNVLFFLAYGLTGALIGFLQYTGVALGVPVAIVVFLLYTQPVWTIILGRLVLDEKITSVKVAAVFLTFVAIVILLRLWEIESIGSPFGILASLLGGIFLSLWIILGRKSQIVKRSYATMIFGWAFFATLWLLILRPLAALLIKEQTIIRLSFEILPVHWVYLAVFSIVTVIIPYLLFFRGIREVQASVAGIILLLEPVSGTVIASVLFSQGITWNIIVGGGLILLSNYFVMRKDNSK